MFDEMNNSTTEQQTETERTGTENENRAEEKTFTQEEVNKIVEKRLNRERQRLASAMGPADPREIELTERERRATERELRIDAAEIFREEHLPEEALELLNYTDKESCDQSIELVKKVFTLNVQEAVNQRLRGGKPPKRAPEDQMGDYLRGAFGLH